MKNSGLMLCSISTEIDSAGVAAGRSLIFQTIPPGPQIDHRRCMIVDWLDEDHRRLSEEIRAQHE
jgi:hypothetical protein